MIVLCEPVYDNHGNGLKFVKKLNVSNIKHRYSLCFVVPVLTSVSPRAAAHHVTALSANTKLLEQCCSVHLTFVQLVALFTAFYLE